MKKISRDLDTNKQLLTQALNNNSDVVFRQVNILDDRKCLIMYIDGLCNTEKMSEFVIGPLVKTLGKVKLNTKASVIDYLQKYVVFETQLKKSDAIDDIVNFVLDGECVLLVDGCAQVIVFDVKGFMLRAISEAPSSSGTKGPREGFVENIKINMTLLRRKIKSPKLKIEMLSAGKYTNTSIAVMYIDGVAQKSVVDEVIEKIKNISIDGILDSSFVERFLEDKNSRLFRQIGNSERPDAVAGRLLEGRVAVIVDGSPIVLTVPFLFIEEIQDTGDYYETPSAATLSRLLRAISVVFGLMLPGFYVALQKFGYQMIPTTFLYTIMNSVVDVPFPPLIEMLIVIVLFDMIQEATSRTSRAGGFALNIVGALVLGDAAIRAGLFSAPAVIIGALNGVGLYAMPDEIKLFSIFRLFFTVLGGIMGLFGVIIGILLVTSYLNGMQVFGTPYLAPYAPHISSDMHDSIIKQGLHKIFKRPNSVPTDPSNSTKLSNKERHTQYRQNKVYKNKDANNKNQTATNSGTQHSQQNSAADFPKPPLVYRIPEPIKYSDEVNI